MPANSKPQGFKTRKGANNKWEPPVAVKQPKSPEEIKRRNGIIITVVAAILIVAAVAGVCAMIISAILKGDSVDYLKDNLSAYINISKDEYTGIEIDIPLGEYSDDMLTAEINKLLVKHKSKDAEANGVGITNKPVALGDVISFRYRVYTVDENGKETEIPGYCNFNDAANATHEVGSESFWFPEFDKSVLGIIPSDYDNFKKIKAGTVSAGDVIYLSYTAFYPTGAAISKLYERIDLSRDDIDETYGEGFKNFMIASAIGEKLDAATFKTADGSIGYSDMKVEFATQCEKSCLSFDVVFPADHNDKTEAGNKLRGTSAKIDVYVDSAVKYKIPEYNAEFITKTLGMTDAELASYEGADTVAKHRSYLKEIVLKKLARSNEILTFKAIWDVLVTKGEVIKYPKGRLDGLIDAFVQNVESYYNQKAEEKGFPSIDSAAIDYFGLESGADWEAHVTKLAEEKVKSELVIYYIIRKEGFLPSDAEYEAEFNAIVQEYADDYLEEYPDKFDEFEGVEYDEQVKVLKDEIKRVYATTINYDVYANILLRNMVNAKYVTVK